MRNFLVLLVRGWLVVGCLALLAGCNLPGRAAPGTATPSPTLTAQFSATPTPSPTATITPTPTATFTPTPTLTPTTALLALEQTPLPADFPPLMLENAAQASGLAAWQESSLVDMAWLPDGVNLAVAGTDTITIYDVLARQPLRTLYPFRGGLVDIALNPSGSWLVSASRQGTEKRGYASSLELWRGPDWKPLGLLYAAPGGLNSVAFSADGKLLAVVFSNPMYEQSYVDFWNTTNWFITNTLSCEALGCPGIVLDIAFSPAGGMLALSPDRYALKVWEVDKHTWLFNLRSSFTGAVNRMVFSPDGLTLAAGHYDGVIRLWDLRSGSLLLTMQTDEVIESLAFSPDGRMLASGGSYANHNVRLWDAQTGALLRTLEGHTSGVVRLLFSPDGRFLVSGSYDGMLRLWGIRP